MFWEVRYFVGDGHRFHRELAIIKADSKEEVLNILNNEIVEKLKKYNRDIIPEITDITECDDSVIIYNSLPI